MLVKLMIREDEDYVAQGEINAVCQCKGKVKALNEVVGECYANVKMTLAIPLLILWWKDRKTRVGASHLSKRSNCI